MRYALVTVAAAAFLAIGGVAQASPHVTPQLQKSHVQDLTFTGWVESVNFGKDTFTVRRVVNGRLEEKEFKIDPTTRVKLNGEWVPPLQLQRMDHVTVTYVAPR